MEYGATYEVEKLHENEIIIRHPMDGLDGPAVLSLTSAQATELSRRLAHFVTPSATVGSRVSQ